MSILVTRPKPNGPPLCDLLNLSGLHSIFFPSIDITPIQNEDLSRLNRYNFAIFISPNAVLHSLDAINRTSLPKTLRIIAIGPGTANTLKERGIPVDVYPVDTANSESLLALPILQDIQQKNILIIRGEGGNTTLVRELTKRNAIVDHAIVYRRKLPTIKTHALTKIFNKQSIDLIVSTSNEGLHNLWTLADAHEKTLLADSPLLVISENMVALAKNLGFKHTPILTRNAQNETILKTILTGSIHESG